MLSKDHTVLVNIGGHVRKGQKIADMLGVYKEGTRYAVAGGLEGERGTKDMIKLHDKTLTKEEIKKIAVIAPSATINVINSSSIEKKLRLKFPDSAENILLCRNINCISRPEMKEGADSLFYTVSQNPITVKCHYCERTIEEKDLKLA